MHSSLPTLVALSWSLLPLGELTESPRRVEATAVYDGHFLCLYANGSIQAWNLKTWKSAKDVAVQFARDGLRAIASDRDKLWAVDGKTVYQWAAKDKQWKKLAAYDAEGEWVVSIIPVGGTPYLVFPAKVVDPTREKGGMFPYPAMIDLFCESPLRILATHGSESKVWIGTGNGEWGGTLIGFDPKTGKWVSSRDGGGYVTGITHSEKDEVIVSWSMSHFAASTRIVDHKADATVKTKHPGMFKKYYQCVAYNPHDELL
ncbi:MAG: hypothetical protein C0467_30865, partial [Planctomycetaceae bacterium]|nr:hypothetical protein [Planctomycetaceae bacterium]